MAARLVVGLMVGAVIAFLLVPVVFWPPRRGRDRQSVYDSLGHPDWIGYLFLAVWIGTAGIMTLRTKARLQYVDEERTYPPMF